MRAAHCFRLTSLLTGVFLAAVAWSVHSQASKLAVLKEAIDAVGAAGDAIAKLTDGIKHLVVTGAQGYDYVSAQREYARLKDLSARSRSLIMEQRVHVVENIDEYLQLSAPTQDDWRRVAEKLGSTLKDVNALLTDVQNERSDLVLEDAYAKLSSSLAARANLLGKLAAMDPPVSPEERAMLQTLQEKYQVLLKNFEAAIEELNLYIKQHKPHTE